MSRENTSEQSSEVTEKVCGGCGRPAAGEVGQQFFCDWVQRVVSIVVKRAPLWKQETRS